MPMSGKNQSQTLLFIRKERPCVLMAESCPLPPALIKELYRELDAGQIATIAVTLVRIYHAAYHIRPTTVQIGSRKPVMLLVPLERSTLTEKELTIRAAAVALAYELFIPVRFLVVPDEFNTVTLREIVAEIQLLHSESIPKLPRVA